MSIVVVANNQLGTDSAMGCDDLIMKVDKFRIYEDSMVAGVGDWWSFNGFLDWYGEDTKTRADLIYTSLQQHTDEEDFEAVVIDPDGITLYNSRMIPVRWNPEHILCLGSGANLAMGALRAGESVYNAIEIACSRNAFCAPPIHVFDIPWEEARSDKETH